MDNDLQLERAEFEQPPAAVCSVCAQPLQGTYFQVNGQVVCPACCDRLRAGFTGGSEAVRLTRAGVAGAVAAFAGGLLYYAVVKLTGYELGLVAIVVGFAVGKAVSWGSNGRGGWRYQAIAMTLTYLSIVGGYVPVILTAMREAGAPLSLWFAIKLACQVPFLGGFENILGIIIIAIGLYEAWKFNRPARFDVTGPHAIAPGVVTQAPA